MFGLPSALRRCARLTGNCVQCVPICLNGSSQDPRQCLSLWRCTCACLCAQQPTRSAFTVSTVSSAATWAVSRRFGHSRAFRRRLSAHQRPLLRSWVASHGLLLLEAAAAPLSCRRSILLGWSSSVTILQKARYIPVMGPLCFDGLQ